MDTLKPTYTIPALPLAVELETVPILKALNRASRALAQLKGTARTIPNPAILIDTLALQEAKASSEIENIVTTQNELFQADLFPGEPVSGAGKEVARYRDALRVGYAHLTERGGVLSNAALIEMFRILKQRDEGFRATPGTALRNEQTGEIVFVPPQSGHEIVAHMTALERFINDDALSDLDPLVKMAIIHHQFESIHPFSDGNGRIGRILNVLYLSRSGLLDLPILYHSRYINRHKAAYYAHLQSVRDTGRWGPWIVFMLDAVGETATTTTHVIEAIARQMAAMKHRMRAEVRRLYSQDLLNNLFRHPYTRIEYVQKDLGVSRQTAANRLDLLVEHGFLSKHQFGRNNYYMNDPLVALLMAAEAE